MTERVSIIGVGYIGLPLAIMLANSGYDVTGVDIDKSIVNGINDGTLHIAEEDISKALKDPIVRKNLHAQIAPSLADIFIICVPTPLDKNKNRADLSHVKNAVRSILPFLRHGNLVIIESTIPPLTCRDVIVPLIKKTGLKINKDVFVCHCPERILPGSLLKEIVEDDRVIGGLNDEAAQMAKELYASFVKGNIYITDDITAELVKCMENTYRDVNIALANEFAAVAHGVGVSVMPAIELANRHPRVNIHRPGIGTGGHCIPIVPWFIHQVDSTRTRLIPIARFVNDAIPYRIASQIKQSVEGISHPLIVALGVTYKPNTDDTRNSPALEIIELLRKDGYQVDVYDPLAKDYEYLPIRKVSKGADCLVVLVEHQAIVDELSRDDIAIRKAMRHPVIIRFFSEVKYG
jgi:UDP-N-acetyl-D-mannosaminuronic acid dehydrogenase